MRFEILGPLQVVAEGRLVPLGPPQQQKLLALLLTSPNGTVTTDRLVEEMWPHAPPASARHLIHVYVSRLRGLLAAGEGEARIVRSGAGYSLVARPDEVDALLLDEGVGEAMDLTQIDAPAARRRLIELSTMWRGQPFGDLSFESAVLATEATRLEELYLGATAERVELDLDNGDHHQVVGELELLTADHPYREKFWAQLMLALYRCGRQADALQACRTLRQILREELGIEPGAEVASLERRILAHDPDLEWEPPPPPFNVPARASTFVGRTAEITATTKLLESSRLVTLTGPGGVGKTSLAAAVAEQQQLRFPDGVWWVDLLPVTDPEMVVASIADVLGVSAGASIHLIDVVAASLMRRDALLVVDNCEHVAAAVADVASTILRRAGRTKILATSRVPLHVDGETLWTVPALAVPEPDDVEFLDAATCDAVQLFVARGSDVDPRFELTADNVKEIVEICHRLDGLPLAIEVAAARLRVLSVTQISTALADRFDLLTRPVHDSDHRHRTLSATLDWSYDGLPADLQPAFDRLSVFASDFDIDAAAAVVGPERSGRSALDVVDALADGSMITVVTTTAPAARYRLLETTREYGDDHLTASGMKEATCEAHADYFLDLMANAGEEIDSPAFAGWTTRIAEFYDDLRLALEWSLEHQPRARTLEAAPAGYHYWYRTGNVREAGRWGRRMLSGAEDAPSHLLVAVHLAIGFRENVGGDIDAAIAHADAAVDLSRRAQDRRSLVTALYGRGSAALAIGDFETVRSCCEEALIVCDEIDHRWGRAGPLSLSGLAEFLTGTSMNEARRLTAQALSLYRELGDIGSQVFMDTRSSIALRQGDTDAAERFARETLTIATGTGWEATALVHLAEVQTAKGDNPGAAATLQRALTRALDVGLENWFRIAVRDLARLALAEHQPLQAARLMGASQRNMPHYGRDPAIYEAIQSGCTDLIDERTFVREVEHGGRMEHEDILRLALTD